MCLVVVGKLMVHRIIIDDGPLDFINYIENLNTIIEG